MKRFLLPAICVIVILMGCEKSGFVKPEPMVSNYFETTGGGFLTENRGVVYVCKYALVLKKIKELPPDVLLEVNFENPNNTKEPLIVNYRVLPAQKEVVIKSPDITSLKSFKAYEVVVKIYSDQSKSQLIGTHTQLIRSEFDLDYINREAGKHKITEPWEFKFDERKWQIGHLQEVENQKIIEYVPSGELIENWTELVTSHTTKDKRFLEINLADLLEVIRSQVITKYSSTEWNIIEQEENYVLFEWSHGGSTDLSPEYYMTRHNLLGENSYSLTYAMKTNTPSESHRKKWIKILKNAALKN